MKITWARSFFFFVLTLFFLTACSSSHQNTSEFFVLSSSGVGPLNKDTLLTEENLKELLPGYLIKKGTYGVEDEVRLVFEISSGEELIFKIYPEVQNEKKIYSIGVVSPKILSSLNLRVGDFYSEFDEIERNKDCVPGIEQMSGQVICSIQGTKNIKFVFSGIWNGPDGEIPPPDILSSYKIIEIVWTNTEYFK